MRRARRETPIEAIITARRIARNVAHEMDITMIDHEEDCAMLEGVNLINWNEYETCSGPAGDVPRWLHNASSSDGHTRVLSLQHLYAALYHQSSRFGATALAIPFLLEIALSSGGEHRGMILEAIAHFVGGPCTLREGFSLCDGQRTVFWGTELPRGTREDEEVAIWRACYNAARGYVPAVLIAAESGPDDVRRAAPLLLAPYRTERALIVPSLQASFARERYDDIRAAQIFAIGMVSTHHADSIADFLVSVMQSDRSLLVCLVAAMVFGWTSPRHVPDVVVDRLVQGLREAAGDIGIEYSALPFGSDLAGDIGHAIQLLPGSRMRGTLQALLSVLDRAEGTTLPGIVQGVLHAALHESFATKYDARRIRAAKAAIFYCDGVWRHGAVVDLLVARGLPGNREQFGRSADLSIENRDAGSAALKSGHELATMHHFNHALESSRKAVELAPHDPRTALNLVWTLSALGRVHEGLEESELALAVFERCADLHFYRATFLSALQQHARAADACTRGLSLDDTAFGRHTRACAYARLGKPEQAIDDLRRCVAMSPEFVEEMRTDIDFESLRSRDDFRQILSMSRPLK